MEDQGYVEHNDESKETLAVVKTCKDCFKDLPISNFYKRTNSNAYLPYCKACQALRVKASKSGVRLGGFIAPNDILPLFKELGMEPAERYTAHSDVYLGRVAKIGEVFTFVVDDGFAEVLHRYANVLRVDGTKLIDPVLKDPALIVLSVAEMRRRTLAAEASK